MIRSKYKSLLSLRRTLYMGICGLNYATQIIWLEMLLFRVCTCI